VYQNYLSNAQDKPQRIVQSTGVGSLDCMISFQGTKVGSNFTPSNDDNDILIHVHCFSGLHREETNVSEEEDQLKKPSKPSGKDLNDMMCPIVPGRSSSGRFLAYRLQYCF
jgi:hypothetical protein